MLNGYDYSVCQRVLNSLDVVKAQCNMVSTVFDGGRLHLTYFLFLRDV